MKSEIEKEKKETVDFTLTNAKLFSPKQQILLCFIREGASKKTYNTLCHV